MNTSAKVHCHAPGCDCPMLHTHEGEKLRRCESCNARVMGPNDVVCADCGFNHETRKTAKGCTHPVGCIGCNWCNWKPTVPTPISPTLPAPAPWYAEGTTGDFSMSELFTFGLILNGLDGFDGVSSVLRYFEKPWKWTGERTRWVELGRPSDAEMTIEKAEYILDAGTTAENFEAWKAQGES